MQDWDWVGDDGDWAGFGEWNEWKENEVNVNLIGKGFGKSGIGKGKGKMCYNCGTVGHMSWECPKGKGKGKGEVFGKGTWQQGVSLQAKESIVKGAKLVMPADPSNTSSQIARTIAVFRQ